jgi:hypothetical protein
VTMGSIKGAARRIGGPPLSLPSLGVSPPED